jgi:hypothetical protein
MKTRSTMLGLAALTALSLSALAPTKASAWEGPEIRTGNGWGTVYSVGSEYRPWRPSWRPYFRPSYPQESCGCEAQTAYVPPPVYQAPSCGCEAPVRVIERIVERPVYVPVRVAVPVAVPVRVEVPVRVAVPVPYPVRVEVPVPVREQVGCNCEAPSHTTYVPAPAPVTESCNCEAPAPHYTPAPTSYTPAPGTYTPTVGQAGTTELPTRETWAPQPQDRQAVNYAAKDLQK